MAKRKAKRQNDYIQRTYDRINLTVPKGEKDKIKAHAESKGESVNGYINRLIAEDMAAEKPEDNTEDAEKFAAAFKDIFKGCIPNSVKTPSN